ncbi:MAG: MFS transporter [Alphaproteobacteria bacterium]|nr:MFS transporter [Alphaproteobacteria bacterium]
MWYVMQGALRGERPRDIARRGTIVATISFLTLIDLFGSQALLPQLVTAYEVDAATMGLAVNASTFGMAVSGLLVGWFADRIDRKRWIWRCLVLLSIPTFLLGVVDSIPVFMALRVMQGVFMAAAFTFTLTYLSEQCDVTAAGGAMAAYITGNVASNLFGRLMAVSAADVFGLSGSFFAFAALNILGALLALTLIGLKDEAPPARSGAPLVAWRRHLADPALRTAFLIGFTILFVFVGVFTYVNLHLVDVLGVPASALGLVYFVFAPAILTTPFAGKAVSRFGPRRVFLASGVVALSGLAVTLWPSLSLVLIGLAVVGAGTFFMQAAATGYVSRTAKGDRAAANGLYLTSYYLGGLVGAFALGVAQSQGGWPFVAGIVAIGLVGALLMAGGLRNPGPEVLPLRLSSASQDAE